MLKRVASWLVVGSLFAGYGLVQPAPAAARSARPGEVAGTVARQYLRGASVTPHTECVSERNIDERIGQTLMPGVDWKELGTLRDLVEAGLIGGVVVLGTPSATVAESIAMLRDAAPAGLVVAVDEEGGRVQRLRLAVGALPSARDQAEQNSPEELAAIVLEHAEGVRALGFDMALAPVLDVGGGPGIGDRAYGSDPAIVSEYGLAVAAGLREGRLLAVAKHFPGHGRASDDSHVLLPTTPPIEELLDVDIEPFRRAIAAGVDAIMVGHLDVPGLTDGLPTSLSERAVTGLLREELGFQGLVMTDALNMGAIVDRWETAEAVELAMRAGIDVMILGDSSEIVEIHEWIEAAVADGRVSERRLTEAAANVLTAKGINACLRR